MYKQVIYILSLLIAQNLEAVVIRNMTNKMIIVSQQHCDGVQKSGTYIINPLTKHTSPNLTSCKITTYEKLHPTCPEFGAIAHHHTVDELNENTLVLVTENDGEIIIMKMPAKITFGDQADGDTNE